MQATPNDIAILIPAWRHVENLARKWWLVQCHLKLRCLLVHHDTAHASRSWFGYAGVGQCCGQAAVIDNVGTDMRGHTLDVHIVPEVDGAWRVSRVSRNSD